MAESELLNVDKIIAKLLEVRSSPPGTPVQLREAEIRGLCLKSREIFLSQPMLLELMAPLKICANYLFLGNYVDHGQQSLETMCLLLAYKIKYPENFFLLRGGHECASENRVHGFYDECVKRYSVRLWKTFTDCFNCFPVASIIEDSIFCVSGGLSPSLHSMEQIQRIMRPTDLPDIGLLCDLMWAEPDQHITGWKERDAGLSFTFGPDVVSTFLSVHSLQLVVRSNQVVKKGFEFFSEKQLVTVFSAPNYRGMSNIGAVMNVADDLLVSFQANRSEDSSATQQTQTNASK